MEPETLVALFSILPPKAQGVVLAVLMFLGSLTLATVVLKTVGIPLLSRLVVWTETKRDDSWPRKLEALVVLAEHCARWSLRMLEIIALHRAPKLKPSKEEE